MLLDNPLTKLFGSTTARVLETLLRSDGMTVRQIARVAGISPTTASAALRRFELQWVVVSKPVGRAIQYWLNDEHFLMPRLREFMQAAAAEEAQLPQLVLAILGSAPRSVIVFGSTARLESEAHSDFDLLIVAHSEHELVWWRSRVDDMSAALGRRLGGPLDVLLVAPPSMADLRRPFWRNAVREGRLLFGEPLVAP